MEIKNIKLANEIKVKPKIADLINAMLPGDTVLFSCIEHGPMQTARSAATRANQRLGTKEYTVTTEDNGATYLVSRASQ